MKFKFSSITIMLLCLIVLIQASIYTGVSWQKNAKKWKATLAYNKKQYYGGYFDEEEQAAMSINLLCDKFGIKRKNPTIDKKTDAMQQIPYTTSIYTGVTWNRHLKKWQTQLTHNYNYYFGGCFDKEEQAAMKANLLCDKYGIKRKNPDINISPDEMEQIPNTTSIYTGVCWNRKTKQWRTKLTINKKEYYGGNFDNEEHAAMSINLLCDKFGIKRKNPKIDVDLIQKNTKSNIDQENIVNMEDESILLYALTDECENNFMKSKDKKISNITGSCKSQKRKRKNEAITNDTILNKKC